MLLGFALFSRLSTFTFFLFIKEGKSETQRRLFLNSCSITKIDIEVIVSSSRNAEEGDGDAGIQIYGDQGSD